MTPYPCPNCGKTPNCEHYDVQDYAVTCGNCYDVDFEDGRYRDNGYSQSGRTKTEAIETWNEWVEERSQ